jgi:hypothetical protein
MKLSHEKIVHLSHVLVRAIGSLDSAELTEDANDVRNRILQVLREELQRDEQVEMRARRRISSQRRVIPEGSPEWEVLFRKYYEEEWGGLSRS